MGILGAWTSAAVMDLGNESRDVQGLECYKNLCGKYVGTVLSWFVPNLYVPHFNADDGWIWSYV